MRVIKSKEFWIGFIVAYVLAYLLHSGALKKNKSPRGGR